MSQEPISHKAQSPARKLMRLLEKENSPVRNFLDSEYSHSAKMSSLHLHEVEPSSMFERITEEEKRLALKEKQQNNQIT